MIASILAVLLTIASPKCRECEEKPDNRNLVVFMSFSLPMESWKAYSAEVEKTGGTLVLRGIPDNSFSAFAAKVQELRKEGVKADIDIDPVLFEEFGVESVPVLLVRDGDNIDRADGHFGLQPFLEESAATGDASAMSKTKLERLR